MDLYTKYLDLAKQLKIPEDNIFSWCEERVEKEEQKQKEEREREEQKQKEEREREERKHEKERQEREVDTRNGKTKTKRR